MLNENLEMHSVKGNTFFELITESRVTKVRKKRWYVAPVLCITLIYNDFIFHRKNEGSRRESRKGRGVVQELSTPMCMVKLKKYY